MTKTQKLKRRRLFRLARHIKNHVEPETFNMNACFVEKDECGTVCCAAGHAGYLFAKEGMTIDRQGSVHYRGLLNFSALQLFLGLKFEEVQYLFNFPHYTDAPPNMTPAMWAARCEQFLKAQAARI